MKRKAAMIVVAGLFLCLPGQAAYGAFSRFVRITPETQDEHHVYLPILSVDGQEEMYRIIPPNVPEHMSTYLIICREKVTSKEQDFREYIWSLGEGRTDVLSVALLSPSGRYGSEPRHVVPLRPRGVLLDKSLLIRTYIYVDYGHIVSDGGDYYCIDLSTYPLPEERTMRVRYSPAEGLGPESGVMRRDPSDIIKADDLYYVWYTKSHVPHGYDATVWYATSTDGHTWVEKGEALPRGPEGSWDAQSVFTPNILIAKGKYYLFYTGVPKPFHNKGNKVTKTAIGIAVAESSDGPWKKPVANPVVRPTYRPWFWQKFDSMRVDDSCLLVRDGRYWLYYKGRRWNDTPAHTEMGLAIAEEPGGPYVRHGKNAVVEGVSQSVIEGGHEVLVWPLGDGVAAMVDIGPEGIGKTIQYAPDGLSFSRMMNLDQVPNAPGAYRPEVSRDKREGRMIEWGLHIGRQEGFLPFLERFDCEWK